MTAQINPVLQLAQGTANVFAWILGIAILLSATVIIFGIVLIIISFMNGSWRETGKDWIKSGITGLLITVLSWLILNTINPGLFHFSLYQLPDIVFKNGAVTSNSTTAVPKITNYQEIPIGTADEKLLAKKINCYDFDAYGDPIGGSLIKIDDGKQIVAPTYLNHDRVDCYLKLSDAAEKKAAVIESLSQQIVNLMNQCSCEGKCQDPCNKDGKGCANPPSGTDCSNNLCGNANTAACKLPDSLLNSYLKTNKDASLSCCPANVRNSIKGYLNSPGDKKVQPLNIKLKIACSSQGGCQDSLGKNYYGLDEFRQGRAGQTSIANLVEKTVKFQKEDLSYIDLDSCPSCIQTCDCQSGDKKCQSQQGQCIKDKQQCLAKKQQCLTNTPWGKLNLYEQLSYITEKMQEISNSITTDQQDLQKNAEKLSSCVMPKSSVDFVNTEQVLDKGTVLLNITKGAENTSTYCQGFGYADSTCNQQCQDMCPITKDSLECYGGCANKKPAEKNTCLNKCDQNRTCKYNPNFSNFGVCMQSCKQTCSGLCQAKYLPCSDEFKVCQSMCNNDSACLSNNIDTCLLNPFALGLCKNANDQQLQNCIDNASKCQYGSQQNAGYEDCLKNPATQKLFSASYLYQNPNIQTCPNPYSINPTNSKFCVQEHPETQKCSATSQCPSCPCGSINQNIQFAVEGAINPPGEINVCSDGTPEAPEIYCENIGKTVKEFRLVGPECSKQGFNGDPLTFYCRQDWWNEPATQREKNLGEKNDKPEKNITCQRSDEIPVGMLVDKSLAWADETTKTMSNISLSIQYLLSFMAKLSTAKDYCACNSKYESGNPVCRACCQYTPGDQEQGIDPSCTFQACSGNSCQQMINWLYEIINYHREIKINYINFYIDSLAEPRTDILKMLTYSRNKINEFSSLENQQGIQNTVLLSCQQILDNIVYPVTDPNNKISIDQKELYHYCYGLLSGKLLNNSAKNDNWFGCQTTAQVDIEEQREENENQKKLYYQLTE